MIDKFDSATAKEVQKATEAVMNDVATKFGLRIHFKGGKYTTTECLYKWTFIINSKACANWPGMPVFIAQITLASTTQTRDKTRKGAPR